MFFWILKQIKKFVKILNSNAAPSQIAAGFALGALIGLVPMNLAYTLTISCIILLLNINITASLLGIAIFGVLSFAIYPLGELLGYFLLVQTTFLTPIWTFLYNLPFIPFLKFNNTLSLGSMIISYILFFPIYLAMKKFVIAYRKDLKTKLEKYKVFKILKLGKLTKWIPKR
jgi:uncharacterized protein (TIGR03546 family)